MQQDHISYLLALHRQQDWAAAAAACQLSPAQLKKAVAGVEREYGCALIKTGAVFRGFTVEGEKVVAWAQNLSEALSTLKHVFAASNSRKAIAPLLERRSVSPKRLEAPGPDRQEIDLMIEAALSAPDHGGLHPWRVLVFPADSRAKLADLFEQEKLRRDPLASAEDVKRAREHATRSPALLAFVISPKPRMRVPEREQCLAAGCALGNLLNAAHQLGYGAIMLSGERCFDSLLCTELGVESTEYLAGFISLGSVAVAPPPRKPAMLDAVRAVWGPGVPEPVQRNDGRDSVPSTAVTGSQKPH